MDILKKLNEGIRRLSAHTTVMTYEDLIVTRQIVLGIGNLNIFYTLKDVRYKKNIKREYVANII